MQRVTGRQPIEIIGWGARIRTWEWRNQNPLPYRLATPQRASRLLAWKITGDKPSKRLARGKRIARTKRDYAQAGPETNLAEPLTTLRPSVLYLCRKPCLAVQLSSGTSISGKVHLCVARAPNISAWSALGIRSRRSPRRLWHDSFIRHRAASRASARRGARSARVGSPRCRPSRTATGAGRKAGAQRDRSRMDNMARRCRGRAAPSRLPAAREVPPARIASSHP